MASNAPRQPSSGARRPTISDGQRRAAVEQMDHALPDRIVVAERSLQPQVAQHQRVEIHGNDVGRPADLGDLPVRPRELQRHAAAVARAGRVAHDVGADRRQAADDLLEALRVSMSTVLGRAEPPRRLESRARRPTGRPTISGSAPASAAMRAHSRPIGPGPSTTTASPGRIVEFTHIALYATACGSDQAGDLERQRIGNAVQAARRHADPLRHRAVDAVAESLARRTEVVASGPAQHALAADVRRRLADDPVAFLEAAHGAPDPRDRAAELVAEHDRDVHRPGMCVPRLVHVRAADRHRADREQHVVVADVRDGDLAQLDAPGCSA